jgi:two-component system, cell cycle sensor histidine kinase and response regulator CckA
MSTTSQTPLLARRLVLVADDEAVIQGLVVQVVSQLGLVALSVGDGAAAIRAVEAHHEELACAILDVRMPIMNGADAAHAIQQIAPDLAIVLMSGAVPVDCVDRITQLRLAGLLSKPFPLSTLRELIRHAVGAGVVLDTV